MIGILRHGLQLGAVMLIALSLRLWHVQPTPDTCDALGLVQDFYGDWSAVSVDGQALWRIQPDGGGMLAAFPDWLILSGQGPPLRVRPDGSHARPLFAPPTAYPDLAVLAWSDDGPRLWFGEAAGDYRLYALEVSTGHVQRLQRLAATVNAVHQATARYLLIFSTEQPKGDWYRFETTTQRLHQLTFTPTRFEDHLLVAPDGQWLLYDAPNGDSVTLYRQPMAGGDEEALLTGPDGFIVVGWSPDGKRLAVWSAGRAVTLHVMDWPDGFGAPSTGRVTVVTAWAGPIIVPCCCPALLPVMTLDASTCSTPMMAASAPCWSATTTLRYSRPPRPASPIVLWKTTPITSTPAPCPTARPSIRPPSPTKS